MILAPFVEGHTPIRTAGPEFLARFRKRVEAGLLTGHPHPRSNYVVTHAGPGALHVSAAGWWTAINVGLNELDLQVSPPGQVHYEVRYWRWAAYAIGLGALLGGIGITLALTLDLRGYIADHPASRFPGLSLDQNVLVAWAMALFWGFVWPWLLVLLHRRPLRRLVERLIAEVDVELAPDQARPQGSPSPRGSHRG
jgi:hypothetical protein